jgi:hypothetical protein
MESAHRDDNTMNRMYCSLPDWETRDRAKMRRAARESDAAVQQHLQSLPGNKRTLSVPKTEERRQKQTMERTGKEERVIVGSQDAQMRVQEMQYE